MGEKRDYAEVEASAAFPSSERQGPARKKYKKNKHKANPSSMNWVKKRARTIERRFKREEGSIPQTVQRDLERELSAHQTRIAAEKDKKQRNKMVKRYHMVRFFERKKAMRLEKQLRDRLRDTKDAKEIAAIEADIHIAEVDKIYAQYFPYMERYASLYPFSEDPKPEDRSSAAVALHSKRPPLWSTVEQAMEKGQDALERLRDRRLDKDSRSAPPPNAPSKHSFSAKARTMQKAEPTKRLGQDAADTSTMSKVKDTKAQSDDSDSDFFEEG